MSSDTSAKPTLRYGMSAIAALALSIALGSWNGSIARAQSDGAAAATPRRRPHNRIRAGRPTTP